MEQDKYKKVLDKIQAQCVRREYCTSDIRAKVLKAVEGDEEIADEMISILSDRNRILQTKELEETNARWNDFLLHGFNDEEEEE